MSADAIRSSLEAKRKENLSQLEFEKKKQFNAISGQAESERSRVKAETNMQIMGLESQQGELQATISNLEMTLDSMPPDHPERGRVEAALAAYRKRLGELKEFVQKLKARLASHTRMISFQELMQKRNVEINVNRQSGLIKARFAEMVGSMLANAERQPQSNMGERKETAAAGA